jgi:hypothetical protein
MDGTDKFLVVMGLVCLIVLVLAFRFQAKLNARDNQRLATCVLLCNSTTVTVEDERCGCITWKEMK